MSDRLESAIVNKYTEPPSNKPCQCQGQRLIKNKQIPNQYYIYDLLPMSKGWKVGQSNSQILTYFLQLSSDYSACENLLVHPRAQQRACHPPSYPSVHLELQSN